ncbi:hypothetical protein HF526_19210 [Pseudonocardia sp. K10HN5]|uniref:Blue (type 1) copper domain-containing protein n=1 Tax=Pseudonocardia acidicola TaxID=2724939 RepID=A0ABX1SCY5_9PSEU|nr:hypothetical protein [Pseudonocardia acidicola]
MLTLTLAGCGGGSNGAAAAPTVPVAVPTTAAAAGTAAAEPAGKQVTVTMSEFALTLSEQTFTPGTYTFVADNTGQYPHTITINGPGVQNQSASGPLKSGQSASLTVTLQPGSYEIWCPVGDHKAKGMTTTITVA